jgi:hypothetical protein
LLSTKSAQPFRNCPDLCYTLHFRYKSSRRRRLARWRTEHTSRWPRWPSVTIGVSWVSSSQCPSSAPMEKGSAAVARSSHLLPCRRCLRIACGPAIDRATETNHESIIGRVWVCQWHNCGNPSTASWGKERCCQNRPQMGQLRRCGVGSRTVGATRLPLLRVHESLPRGQGRCFRIKSLRGQKGHVS